MRSTFKNNNSEPFNESSYVSYPLCRNNKYLTKEYKIVIHEKSAVINIAVNQ